MLGNILSRKTVLQSDGEDNYFNIGNFFLLDKALNCNLNTLDKRCNVYYLGWVRILGLEIKCLVEKTGFPRTSDSGNRTN